MKPLFTAVLVGLFLLIIATVIIGINVGLAGHWIAAICLGIAGIGIIFTSVKMSRHGTNNTTVVHK